MYYEICLHSSTYSTCHSLSSSGPTGNGIGYHTSLWLADSGYHVILAGRSQDRLETCRNEIIKSITAKQRPINAPPIQVTPLVCDLGSLKSIEKFYTEFEKLNLPLHILINKLVFIHVHCEIDDDDDDVFP